MAPTAVTVAADAVTVKYNGDWGLEPEDEDDARYKELAGNSLIKDCPRELGQSQA